jgi:hypothetical protein
MQKHRLTIGLVGCCVMIAVTAGLCLGMKRIQFDEERSACQSPRAHLHRCCAGLPEPGFLRVSFVGGLG